MVHDVREMLRWTAGRKPRPTAIIVDGATRQSTPESGHRGGYDGETRRKGSKIHVAVDTLGHLLALLVTPANVQDREQVEALATAVQAVTGGMVEVGLVNQGDPGEQAVADAAAQGVRWDVVKLEEAKRGFVPLPRRWVVEHSFA